MDETDTFAIELGVNVREQPAATKLIGHANLKVNHNYLGV